MPISIVLVVERAEWMKSGNDICQWWMVAYMSQQAGKETYQGHVDGVIVVEELAEPAPAATLAVVQGQQWYHEPAGEMEHAVGGVVEDEESDGIERNEEHEP